jgi:hypothetical protein
VEPKQAEKIAVALEIGTLSLSLQSLAREEEPVEGLLQPASLVNGEAKPKRSYTLDLDVLYMVGAPFGLPHPGVAPETVDVLHGSKAEQLKF